MNVSLASATSAARTLSNTSACKALWMTVFMCSLLQDFLIIGNSLYVAAKQACLRTVLFPRKANPAAASGRSSSSIYDQIKARTYTRREEIGLKGVQVPPLSRHLPDG